MINFATNLFAFILVLGFLIFAHEAGHFLFAKLFKVRVLVFSFGFGKRLFGFQRGDTDYRVSLIPLGGYVRMAGDTPEETTESDPNEFLSRPKWQRFLILVAGPGVNLVIAIVFLAWMNMTGVLVARDSRPILGSVLPNRPAAAAGLRQGDLITEANGDEIRSFEDLRLVIGTSPGQAVRLKFMRQGKPQEVTVVPQRQETEFGAAGVIGVTPFAEPEVGQVLPASSAGRAGLREGDRIVSANGKKVVQLLDLETVLSETPLKPISLELMRGGQLVATILQPQQTGDKVYPGFGTPTVIRKFGPIAAVRESFNQNMKMVKYTLSTLGRLFQAKGSVKDFSGPISIARISGDMLRTGWKQVISLMAMISLQLGIMNLMPIPVLDGGHIFILLLEGLFRREFSLRVKERIQQVGFAALATLMLVVLYNDVLQNVMRLRNG